MPKRILLVEDSPDVAALFALFFDSPRYDVERAGSLDEARLAIASRPLPDLVVIDTAPSAAGGLALCRELKAAWPACPVVVLSTPPRPWGCEDAVAPAADAFIQHPVDFERLEATMERLVPEAGRSTPVG